MEHKPLYRIIFLDFDGVVVTMATHFRELDPDCIRRLKQILFPGDIRIVVSSTWRYGHPLAELRDMFEKQGVDPKRLIGVTRRLHIEEKDSPDLFGRGAEITDWLCECKQKIQVKSYLVLDDDVFDLKPHASRQVHTDSHNGLQDDDVPAAIHILDTPLLNF